MLGLRMRKVAGELALIQQIRAGSRVRSRTVALGIGDDCAILRVPRGHEMLVTTDFSLEGRHFRRDWHSAESAGHRCLARGLSDLAAMGAKPLAAFLSLALPPERLATRAGKAWVRGFFAGLHALGGRLGTPLAGGDTSEAPGDLVLADIVLVGSAPAGRALRRGMGRAGDLLYVTGALGGAAAELAVLAAGNRVRGGGHPQLFPEPRLGVGQALLRRGLASACIDLSDGLSTDLTHLCAESGVSAEVDAGELPIHPLALQTDRALGLALHGGEDYELLFAAPAGTRVPRSVAGVSITRIGRLLPAHASARTATIALIGPSGRRRPLKPGGWEHFVRMGK